ncbi:[NiFe]-hydrogenase assembly chaperone HybE [Sagittula sp. S175]|uniref:[NiFe]-hydrogenase assembly chaperone HybE n=1 Tax=Sagittula sp. S175 TaxID=3415129 RepID=UPI003C7AA936
MTGFEGSYLGASDKISDRAIMECKICWTPYDPAEGDDTRQVEAGTPFLALPDDWSCPNCSAPKEQFLVQSDPGSTEALEAQAMAPRVAALEADFREIWHSKMRDVPMINAALQIEAIGFQMHEGRPLGVLITPWFMNLFLLSAEGEDWSGLKPGEKEVVRFPSGDYEFIHNVREQVGGYKACSLFSPMGDFKSHRDATDVARAVMVALFQEEHRAETDRSADIRKMREDDLKAQEEAEKAAAEAEAEEAAEEVELDPTPSRRAVITGGLAAASGE